MAQINNPLVDPSPKEVPLKHAPLIRVIAQIRFPQILSIEKKDVVSSFQEAIRKNYPILQQEKTQGFIFGGQGIVPSDSQTIWRFMDQVDSWHWRVSLASNFLALETTSYKSRSDFVERLKNVMEAWNNCFQPTIIERFGLRYVDRLTGKDCQDVSSLIKPEISGIITTNIRENIHQAIVQSLFIIPNTKQHIVARWGLLPQGGTYDPDVIKPITEPSWILDLDMSLSENTEFMVERIAQLAKEFSERLYTFFRWVIQDEFLLRFGGKL